MISVVMPVHRQDNFLELALISIFENLAEISGELILVIDSKDEKTIEFIESKVAEVSKKYSRFFRITQSPGSGIVDALNHGFSLTENEFIARMDSDDVMVPNRLAIQLAFLQAHPKIVAVGSNIMLIDEFGRDIREVIYPQGPLKLKTALEKGSFLAHPSVMLRKSAFYNVGGYSDTYRYAEDFDLWTRLAKVGDLDNIPQVLLKYRTHDSQVSQLKRRDQDLSTQAIILRNRIEKGLAIKPNWNPKSFEEIERWVDHVQDISFLENENTINKINQFDDLILKARRHFQYEEYHQTLIYLSKTFIKFPKQTLKFLWFWLRKKTQILKRATSSKKERRSNSRLVNNSNYLNEHHAIIVELKGGMGNQLFQFFTGINLSKRFGHELILDVSELEKDSKRNLALDFVIIREKFRLISRIYNGDLFLRNCGCNQPYVISERFFHYSKIDLPKNQCFRLEGYWQSWKYFNEIRDEISEYFSPVLEDERFPGVTAHVRGGDMLREPEHFYFHGVQTSEYYEKALRYFPGKKIRVITDDPQYAYEIFCENLNLQVEIVSSQSQAKDFAYLRNSKYIIIANSTFSWWAAYLGCSENVIAPKAWFSQKGLEQNNIDDLFPHTWILI